MFKLELELKEERENFLKSLKQKDIQDRVRSVEEAEIVEKFLQDFHEYFSIFLKDHHYLRGLFEKDFGRLSLFEKEDFLLKKIFLDDDLFHNCDEFTLSVKGEFSEDVIKSHYDFFEEVKTTYLEDHESTQAQIKERLTINTNPLKFSCQCQQCLSLYKAKLIDILHLQAKGIADEFEEKIDDLIVTSTVGRISQVYGFYEKKIQNILFKAKFKLRKSSFKKLEKSFEDLSFQRFGPKSDTVKVYREKIKALLFSELEDMKPDAFTEEEMNKFFDRLKLKVWKAPSFLKREFVTYVETIQQFKRKDISSTILREYLGQFWLYSEARKLNRTIHYHMGPTNSGKTYHALKALAEAPKGCYLAPLRLLASEVFDKLNEQGVRTNLLTGEEVLEVEGASHYSSTIEMARLKDTFDCVVIDEIQMITDIQRGWAWTRALVHMNSKEIHICGDQSAKELVERILKLTGDELVVHEYERMTELHIEERPVRVDELQKGDALIVFSRRNALKRKIDLEKHGHKVSIIYGALNPDVRREQARRFDQEETSVIVSTDAISMGMNLPVRRIVFSTFVKHFKNQEHPLTDSHIKQIAGRAGRFGRFPKGYVSWIDHPDNDSGYETLEKAIYNKLDYSEIAMVGPDLDLFLNVNQALEKESLKRLRFSEFLRLFFAVDFEKPFECVVLDEMIEVAQMVEEIDRNGGSKMSAQEIFGFSCAPVSLGNREHVEYFYKMVDLFAKEQTITPETIDTVSNDIDYLETSIKCMELYQWLARHFQNKFFEFDTARLFENKLDAVAKLNKLLSDKTVKYYNPNYRNQRRSFRKKSDRGGRGSERNRGSSRKRNGGYQGKSKRSSASNSSGKKTRR